jgi:hypothetical protein
MGGIKMSNELIVQDNNSVIVRAEIDSMIATANAYPRDVEKAIEQAIQLATMNEEIAASCFYALPRKDKDGNKIEVKGKSIRLAEIMMSCWKHLHAATRIIEVSEKHITTAGVCWDLQQNVKVEMPDKVSIWFGEKGGKGGYRANNDMQIMLSKASCSKALRNAIFRVISPAFADIVYNAAMKKAVGDTKTVNAKLNVVIDKLVKMGVNKEEMLEYFGHKNLMEFTADDLQSLIGIGTALKEGMIKPEEVFSVEKTVDESASDKINDLIASKKAPKLEQPVNAETGEIEGNYAS